MGHNKVRLYELDVFRGLAALAVVLYHYTFRYEELFQHSKKEYFLDYFKYGFLGVQLFFIISGFVIFMTLEKTSSFKDFIIKRSMRLYPAYIVSVILTFTLVSLYNLEGRVVSVQDAVLNLTMLQGLIPGVASNVDGVYWSLAIEIIFYIFMSILLVVGLIRRIELPIILWLVSSFIVRGLDLISESFFTNAIQFYGIMNYCHLFIAGIMFYKLKSGNKVLYHTIIFACLTYSFIFNGAIEGSAVLLFFLLFYALITKKLTFLNQKFLTFFGTISYSLYLIHQNIGYIVINFLEKNGFTNEIFIIIPVFVSVALASIITFYIERPLQKLVQKMNSSRKLIVSSSSKAIS